MVIIFLDNIWVFLNVRNYWILISNLSNFLSTANSDILGVFGTLIFFFCVVKHPCCLVHVVNLREGLLLHLGGIRCRER